MPESQETGEHVAISLSLEPVHHIRLTVTDIERSRAFYTDVLGFEVAVAGPPAAADPNYAAFVENLQGGIVLTGSGILLGLRPADEERQSTKDRFDPFRVGLDHLSFKVTDRASLEAAVATLDEHGIPHGVIADLPIFGISVLSLEDPDGIQLELNAPL